MAGNHRSKQSAMKYSSKEFGYGSSMDSNFHNHLLGAIPTLSRDFAQVLAEVPSYVLNRYTHCCSLEETRFNTFFSSVNNDQVYGNKYSIFPMSSKVAEVKCLSST